MGPLREDARDSVQDVFFFRALRTSSLESVQSPMWSRSSSAFARRHETRRVERNESDRRLPILLGPREVSDGASLTRFTGAGARTRHLPDPLRPRLPQAPETGPPLVFRRRIVRVEF